MGGQQGNDGLSSRAGLFRLHPGKELRYAVRRNARARQVLHTPGICFEFKLATVTEAARLVDQHSPQRADIAESHCENGCPAG